jgi:hypothetical protein
MTSDENSIPAPPPAEAQATSIWKRRLLIATEILLVLIIVGLLIATWLPAFIGARPGITPRQ